MPAFRILAPVDLAHLEDARALLRDLTARYPDATEVHVVHVLALTTHSYVESLIPRDMLDSVVGELHATLDQLLAEAGLGGTAVAHLLRGDVAGQILALAERLAPDLLVLNAHRADARITSLGSNAAQIARNARCSVLIRR